MSNKNDHLSDLLNTKQAAQRLGVDPQTLKRWADAGEGPGFIEISGRRRYSTDVIRQWLAGST